MYKNRLLFLFIFLAQSINVVSVFAQETPNNGSHYRLEDLEFDRNNVLPGEYYYTFIVLQEGLDITMKNHFWQEGPPQLSLSINQKNKNFLSLSSISLKEATSEFHKKYFSKSIENNPLALSIFKKGCLLYPDVFFKNHIFASLKNVYKYSLYGIARCKKVYGDRRRDILIYSSHIDKRKISDWDEKQPYALSDLEFDRNNVSLDGSYYRFIVLKQEYSSWAQETYPATLCFEIKEENNKMIPLRSDSPENAIREFCTKCATKSIESNPLSLAIFDKEDFRGGSLVLFEGSLYDSYIFRITKNMYKYSLYGIARYKRGQGDIATDTLIDNSYIEQSQISDWSQIILKKEH